MDLQDHQHPAGDRRDHGLDPVEPLGVLPVDLSDQFSKMISADKVLVQKSGYFSRAAPANAADRKLIKKCCAKAVACALRGASGDASAAASGDAAL